VAKITGIMTVSKNGVIGKGGTIPWRHKEDREFFQDKIKNNIIIMGRKTYDTLPQIIIDLAADAIVFSRTDTESSDPKIKFVSSLEEFLQIIPNYPDDKGFYVIGGSEIAKLFLDNNLIDSFYITLVNKDYEGDRFFDIALLNKFNKKLIKKEKDYSIFHYV
jgi:dihydrofolate reductase